MKKILRMCPRNFCAKSRYFQSTMWKSFSPWLLEKNSITENAHGLHARFPVTFLYFQTLQVLRGLWPFTIKIMFPRQNARIALPVIQTQMEFTSTIKRSSKCPEHFTLEMPCKDLSSNPCRQTVAGRLCLPLSIHLRR